MTSALASSSKQSFQNLKPSDITTSPKEKQTYISHSATHLFICCPLKQLLHLPVIPSMGFPVSPRVCPSGYGSTTVGYPSNLLQLCYSLGQNEF